MSKKTSTGKNAESDDESAATGASASTRKTVSKAMQILHSFSNDEPELSLTVLCERLDMHKSVVSRLVSTLMEWRMLERDPVTKRLRLGLGALQLGMQVANQNSLYRLALPLLGNLVERTRHSAHVSELDGEEMLVMATVQSPDALRVTLRQGDRRPLHATAAGKVMLAYLPSEVTAAILDRTGLPRLTKATLTSRRALDSELEAITESGIAWNEGESVNGVGGCAAGVFDTTHRIIGAVSSVFPLTIVPTSQRAALANEVRRTAAALSEALGMTSVISKPRRK